LFRGKVKNIYKTIIKKLLFKIIIIFKNIINQELKKIHAGIERNDHGEHNCSKRSSIVYQTNIFFALFRWFYNLFY